MNSYDAAVTAWARDFLGDQKQRSYLNFYDRTEERIADLVDWDQPCTLRFDYEEPYQYSEYTGGGGTGEIVVLYPLIGGGVYAKTYADMQDLNGTDLLPKLIQQILAHTPKIPDADTGADGNNNNKQRTSND